MGCAASSDVSVARASQPLQQRYELLNLIEDGGFAEVWSAKSRATGETFAAKMPSRTQQPQQTRIAQVELLNEAKLLRKIQPHPHVVKIQEVLGRASSPALILERYDSTLFQKRQALLDGTLDFTDVLRQMLLGLAHVHASGFVHRNVRLESFQLVGNVVPTVRLGDFSLAVALPMTDGARLQEPCGTSALMSPEMASGSGYDAQTDIWSLGASLYWLLFGRYPYQAASGTSSACLAAIRSTTSAPTFELPSSAELPEDMLELLRCMLRRNCGTRCSARGALNHKCLAVRCQLPKELGASKEWDWDDAISTMAPSSPTRSLDVSESLGALPWRAAGRSE